MNSDLFRLIIQSNHEIKKIKNNIYEEDSDYNSSEENEEKINEKIIMKGIINNNVTEIIIDSNYMISVIPPFLLDKIEECNNVSVYLLDGDHYFHKFDCSFFIADDNIIQPIIGLDMITKHNLFECIKQYHELLCGFDKLKL